MVNIFDVKGRKKVRMDEFGNHVLNDLRNGPDCGNKVAIISQYTKKAHESRKI